MKKIINSKNAPSPIGPYSHSVKASGSLLFISGQVALDLEGNMIGDDIKSQTRKSLENMGEILKESGLDFQDVVKCTVLLNDMNHFSDMNEVYAQFFGDSKPSRAAFEVSRLPKDALVEIEAIAVFND